MNRMLALLVGSSLFVSACGDPSPGTDAGPGVLACEPGTHAWLERVRDARDGLTGACARDEDCVFATTDLTCPEGAFVGTCPEVVAESEAEALAASLASAAEALCPQVDPLCSSSPMCIPTEPACRGGVCVAERAP